ncbi:(2Fe-2S)-binding protein [Litoreibacter roseus]|uniref:(2Fe-2S)-binding protein n=1 Tax=Litoreibacter roseus TaxID=2601869 RepID=A0A6N6JFR7_9RHOB|nr:(2Fe-2S)-binding protein [Litoreibacter roseus]GFE64807.1 (2Fe-2S)-binding protein [Litoreibacter roseus]
MSISFTLNGDAVTADVDPEKPLLWVIREDFQLTGTKFGCGIAACGACTVHVDGIAMRTCVLPVEAVAERNVRTIEDLDIDGTSNPLQTAWLEHQVPQCGYCQSGMIMAAEALLQEIPNPTDEDINAAMTNICRCGTYDRVRNAIHTAAKARQGG